MSRGRFITFEGLDGSGKSTHLHQTAAALRALGLDVVETQEPGGTPIGDGIRAVFLDPARSSMDGGVELLLVFASRRQHLIEVIDPALERGAWVLCDRFTDSTWAYQGSGRGVEPEQIDHVDEFATGRRRPDLTLLFDLPAAEARRRGQSGKRAAEGAVDRIDREGLAFYQRVRDAFLAQLAQDPERVVCIDSSGSKEQTHAQVLAVFERHFELCLDRAADAGGAP